MDKIFIIQYPGSYLGSYLGGRAVVKASNDVDAWNLFKIEYPGLDPFKQCDFEELPDRTGVFYNWDGDY